jgi:hypothetical protein
VAVSLLHSHLDIVCYILLSFSDLIISDGCDVGAYTNSALVSGLGPVSVNIYNNMHNGRRNNYHASSNYHHLSSSQAPQHRFSRFPQNTPNRGNFTQGGDSVNNWSRVRDNSQRVPEERVSFGGSERILWGSNSRGHWNLGGNFQRASQSQSQSYQMDSNNCSAAEPDVDEWGREIRGTRQSPTCDESLGERTRDETLDHEIHMYVRFVFSASSNVRLPEESIARPRSAKDLDR